MFLCLTSNKPIIKTALVVLLNLLTIKNGKEHGLWNHWYIDGKRNMEANFNNGVLDGQFKRWFDNGYLAYERIYSNGQLIEEKIPPHSKKTE